LYISSILNLDKPKIHKIYVAKFQSIKNLGSFSLTDDHQSHFLTTKTNKKQSADIMIVNISSCLNMVMKPNIMFMLISNDSFIDELSCELSTMNRNVIVCKPGVPKCEIIPIVDDTGYIEKIKKTMIGKLKRNNDEKYISSELSKYFDIKSEKNENSKKSEILTTDQLKNMFNKHWVGKGLPKREFARIYVINQSNFSSWVNGKKDSKKSCQSVRDWISRIQIH
jgi:hypothetical protein